MQNPTLSECAPATPEISSQSSLNTKLMALALKSCESKLKTAIRIFLHRLEIADARSTIELELEDVLQNTVETALKNADDFNFGDPNAAPLAWLKQIALNHVRHLKRRQQQQPVVSIHDAAPERDEEGEARSEAELFDSLQHPVTDAARLPMPSLEELLPLLPTAYREVLVLSIRDNLSPAQLAIHFGVSPGAAYTKLSRARAHLKQGYKNWKARQRL